MQTILVDITPGFRMPTIYYSQGDVGTQFAIDLRSRFGDSLPASPTVTIQATKPSGFGFSVAADSITNGVATFTMTSEMSDEAGRFPAELKVVKNSVTLFTANFYMQGEATTHPEGTTDGSAETIIPELTQLVDRAETAANSVNDRVTVTTTLAAGSDATYTYDEDTNTQTFGIPRGADGSLASGVLAPTYSSSSTYAVGDYVYYSGSLYRCTTAITTAEAWTSGHWTQVALAPEASDLKAGINNKVNSIKNIVALEVSTPTYSMLTDKVMSAAGIISAASGTAYKVTDYIPVEAGWVVTCKYSRARWGNQNWAFYDADKNVVSTYGKTASSTTAEYCKKIIVPYGAKYFVAARDENGISNEPATDVVIIKKYAESIDYAPYSAIKDYQRGNMDETAYTLTSSSSKVIGTSGLVTSTSSSDYLVSECDVTDRDVINIRNCQARYSNKMYAFYDASGLPINVKERIDNNAHDFIMLKVPFGATKLAVSGYSSYATVTKVTKLQVSGSGWADKKWAAMGDSITDDNNARATKRYYDYIQDETGIQVVNLGKSGTGYMKPYNSNLPFYQRVDTIPLDSDVITIFGSGNDCSLTLGDVTDTGTTTVCGCINNTIDGIRARIVGANIGIITPTPWQPYPTEVVGNAMDLYSNALVEICKRKGVPCLDLYHCSNMLPWEQSFREAFYTRDDGNGTHPDENGHKFFSSHIEAFLKTLLLH